MTYETHVARKLQLPGELLGEIRRSRKGARLWEKRCQRWHTGTAQRNIEAGAVGRDVQSYRSRGGAAERETDEAHG
jgi:hypothetical protein